VLAGHRSRVRLATQSSAGLRQRRLSCRRIPITVPQGSSPQGVGPSRNMSEQDQDSATLAMVGKLLVSPWVRNAVINTDFLASGGA
jgi:hypothetical protein